MTLLLTGGGERERRAHGEEQIESISIAKSRPWLEVLVAQVANSRQSNQGKQLLLARVAPSLLTGLLMRPLVRGHYPDGTMLALEVEDSQPWLGDRLSEGTAGRLCQPIHPSTPGCKYQPKSTGMPFGEVSAYLK